MESKESDASANSISNSHVGLGSIHSLPLTSSSSQVTMAPPAARTNSIFNRRNSYDALKHAVQHTHQQQQHQIAHPQLTPLSPPRTLFPPSPTTSPGFHSMSGHSIPTRSIGLPAHHHPSHSQPPPHPHATHPPHPQSFHGTPFPSSTSPPLESPAVFPFPALCALDRSHLLHVLEYQTRLSGHEEVVGIKADPDSMQHYQTVCTAIRSLNMSGQIYNFSFVHSSCISPHLLSDLKSLAVDSDGVGKNTYASRLTPIKLLDILHTIRNSPSPNLAHPAELPPTLLDAGVYYKPEETKATALQLSPFIYHRVLAMLSLMLNLHIHQMTLARILHLLQGIDQHLDYWLNHQALTSLPKPYRLWKWFLWKFNGASANTNPAVASFSSSLSGLQSPRKPQRQYSFHDIASAFSNSSKSKVAAAAASLNPYNKWSRMAARNVRELVAIKKQWTARCGKIATRMNKLQRWLVESFARNPAAPRGGPSSHSSHPNVTAQQFHQRIAKNAEYFAAIYRYIVQNGEEAEQHRSGSATPSKTTSPTASSSAAPSTPATVRSATTAASFNSSATIQQKIYALYSQFGQFEHFLVSFETHFTTWFENEINLRRKPHHLFEHWHRYTFGALVVGGFAFYAMRNPTEVRTTINSAIEGTRFFMNEHLVEPLQNILETVFKTFHDRALFSTNEQTLTQSKQNLTQMLAEFARNHSKELSSHEGLSRQGFEQTIDKRAQQNDMDLVMKTYEREIEKPILSLLFGDLMRGLLIQVQKVKVDTEAATLALDQIIRSNEINFNILATIPFVILAYGCVDFSSRFFLRGTWKSKEVRHNVRESRKILAELEQIFILHLMSPNANAISVATGGLGFPTTSSPNLTRGPPLHTQIHTLTLNEFASLSSQDQEDEDESLRNWSPASSALGLNQLDQGRPLPDIGMELYAKDDPNTAAGLADLSEEEVEGDEEPQPQSSSLDHSEINLSVSQTFSVSPTTPLVHGSSNRSTHVLGLPNHAFGHTLLLLHELSHRFASLPLASTFASRQLSSSPGSQDPRLIMHKDLLLLASNQLTPQQKLKWIAHMWHSYSFLKE